MFLSLLVCNRIKIFIFCQPFNCVGHKGGQATPSPNFEPCSTYFWWFIGIWVAHTSVVVKWTINTFKFPTAACMDSSTHKWHWLEKRFGCHVWTFWFWRMYSMVVRLRLGIELRCTSRRPSYPLPGLASLFQFIRHGLHAFWLRSWRIKLIWGYIIWCVPELKLLPHVNWATLKNLPTTPNIDFLITFLLCFATSQIYSAPLEGGWGVNLILNPKSFFFGWVVGAGIRCPNALKAFPPDAFTLWGGESRTCTP